ncbi:MAG: 5-formyltetrahydrofolate cyclo-ligase [Oscillospiraceae bacterium]|jgi:5-formyltetrahydrofolate cyclo-ligase|nr:5-formyltetrahydrofolate cyclo-ligase [Oscillospiraceae bacterium]
MNSITAQKKELRAAMMQQRRAMSFAFRREADRAIAEAVLRHPAYRAAKQVLAYVSMPHEVGTRAILEAVLADGKTLGLPVCEPETCTMLFYRLDALSELTAGAYRIPVPPASPERLLVPSEDTLMIVPMLAFDGQGYRLGAGGGYYDRFLAAHSVQAVGICYADCRMTQLPHDNNDRKLASCVTEQKTEDFYG